VPTAPVRESPARPSCIRALVPYALMQDCTFGSKCHGAGPGRSRGACLGWGRGNAPPLGVGALGNGQPGAYLKVVYERTTPGRHRWDTGWSLGAWVTRRGERRGARAGEGDGRPRGAGLGGERGPYRWPGLMSGGVRGGRDGASRGGKPEPAEHGGSGGRRRRRRKGPGRARPIGAPPATLEPEAAEDRPRAGTHPSKERREGRGARPGNSVRRGASAARPAGRPG
jgi:hypothetical protein